MTDLKSARIFLANLHGAAVDDGGHHLVVWTLQDKSTKTFTLTDEAADYAVERAESGSDVYHGVCPLSHPPKSGRGIESDVGVVCHLWLDLDVASDAHKQDVNYCPAIADGLTWLDQLAHRPSIVVHSGHGLQAYWMLKAPIRIGNDEDRAQAKAITIGWINRLKGQCAWALDPVGDLARVFRIPGTVNAKGGSIVPVQFVERNWTQYDIADLFDGNVPKPIPITKTFELGPGVPPDGASASDLYPNADAGLPLAIIKMCEADSKFKKTWNRRRKEFKSASEYDMSITTMLLQGEANDQLIADSIYVWRKLNSEDTEKLFRKPGPRGTYMRALIDKCRATMQHCTVFGEDLDIALQTLSELIAETAYAIGAIPETSPQDQAQPDPAKKPPRINSNSQPIGDSPTTPMPTDPLEQKKQKVFNIVSEKIGVRLLELIQTGRDDALYNFLIQNGKGPVEAKIGSGADLLSSRKCRGQLVNYGIVLPPMKDAAWSTIIKAILPFAKHRGDDEGRATDYTHAIEEYLNSKGAVPWGDRLDAMNDGLPFVSKDASNVCIYLPNVLKHINTVLTIGKRIAKMELCDGISQIGFTKGHAEYNAGGTHKHMSYWYGPAALLPNSIK